MRRLMTSLVLLFSSASCADEMSHDSTDIGRTIQEVREEVDRHHSAVFALQNRTEVLAEMQRHDDNMLSMMNRMHESIGAMSHCSAGAMGSMRQMMEDMETEMDRHSSGIAEADGLEDVRSACAVHVEAMTGSLNAMQHAAARSSCMFGR